MIAENEHEAGQSSDDSTELLTAGDLARRLRVSLRQVRRLNKSGAVPAPLKIGQCVRWHSDEIDRWLKDGAPARSEREKRRDAELAPTVEAS